jgi:hypothetical protein
LVRPKTELFGPFKLLICNGPVYGGLWFEQLPETVLPNGDTIVNFPKLKM